MKAITVTVLAALFALLAFTGTARAADKAL